MNLPSEDPDVSLRRPPDDSTDVWAGPAIILLSTAFVAWFVLQSQPLQSANDRSRWCTVWSLVERGTYQIDEIDQVPEWSTIDKVRHRRNDTEPRHFYSSKPPLFSTVVAGLYWLERKTLGYDLQQNAPLVSRLLLIIINVIPWCLALFSFRSSLQLLAVDRWTQWLVLLTAGFSSMLNPFLTTLNNHTPAAICLIFCLSAMVRLFVYQPKRNQDFVIIGLTAALVTCFELPAALFGVCSFLVVAFVDWKKTLRWYVPAAIIPLAAFFVTNWICTGGIKPFYAYYGEEQYVYVHEGIPSYWSNPQGIDANSESFFVYLFHCVLGHHGLLSMTPVNLLSIAGCFLLFSNERLISVGDRSAVQRRIGGAVNDNQTLNYGSLLKSNGSAKPIRLITWMGAVLTTAILVFYLTKFKNYNYGGNSAALRWMLWLTPFWWYGLIFPIRALRRSKTGTVVVCLLLFCSVYSSIYSIRRPWQPGWIYQRMFNAGLIDYRTKVPPFNPPRYSILKSVPELTVGEWTGTTSEGSRSLRIESFAEQRQGGQALLPLQIDCTREGKSRSASVVIFRKQFQRGEDIAVWLRSAAVSLQGSTEPHRTGSSDRFPPAPGWVVDLIRGLPTSRPYNAETPRYRRYTRSTGEKWALRCNRGASRVAVVDPQHQQCWHRCDVSYSDEVPFGVAAWKISVVSQRRSEIVRSESWITKQLPE